MPIMRYSAHQKPNTSRWRERGRGKRGEEGRRKRKAAEEKEREYEKSEEQQKIWERETGREKGETRLIACYGNAAPCVAGGGEARGDEGARETITLYGNRLSVYGKCLGRWRVDGSFNTIVLVMAEVASPCQVEITQHARSDL